MNNRLLLAVLTLTLFAMTGCNVTDGANGSKNKVRFSEIFNYQETGGFDPGLVINSSTLIQLQHPQSTDVVDPPGFPELTLEVKPLKHDGAAKVLPLGFAQFAISMDTEGTWELIAKDRGTTLDTLDVQVMKVDHVRFAAKASITTIGSANGHSCVNLAEVTLTDLVLHPNQRLTLFAVPANDKNEALIGLLPLTAHTDSTEVELELPLLTEGGQPNGVVVNPKGGLTKQIDLKIESTLTSSFTQRIAVSNDDAPIDCK